MWRHTRRKTHGRKPDQLARKQNLTRNSHSSAFKVMHFGITEKPAMDCISLHNNAGLISKATDGIASKITENCRCRQPHCRLKPPLQRTPANIRISLILAKTSIGLHLCRWQYRSIFIQIFVMGSERRMCFKIECIIALQGHPRSLILAPNESAYATSHWSAIVTLIPSFPKIHDFEWPWMAILGYVKFSLLRTALFCVLTVESVYTRDRRACVELVYIMWPAETCGSGLWSAKYLGSEKGLRIFRRRYQWWANVN